jgi:hypothetical protein
MLCTAVTWRPCQIKRSFPNRRGKGAYMPKSAMTMSDDGSFVRYKMFSGLSKCPIYQERGLAEIGLEERRT